MPDVDYRPTLEPLVCIIILRRPNWSLRRSFDLETIVD